MRVGEGRREEEGVRGDWGDLGGSGGGLMVRKRSTSQHASVLYSSGGFQNYPRNS